MGQQALDLLNSSYLKKIVLSRVKKLPLSTSYKEIFENLTQKYPNAFVYLAVGPFGIWAGASPEILIESDYKKLKTVALAGTQEYVHSKNKYDWGDKEKEEQNLVSEYIAEILKQNQVPFHMGQPQTVQAGNVVHLKSIFECDVKNKEQVHQILKSLHPTPAVAGISTPTSIEEIIRLEPHNRKFYTGYIGEISDFNTRLYVNLRCMEFIENNVYLYVGGGFTRHSDVESEWKETESKARVLLGVL